MVSNGYSPRGDVKGYERVIDHVHVTHVIFHKLGMFFIMQLGLEKGVGVVMAKAVPSNKIVAPISNIVKLNSVYLLIFEVFN